MKKNTNIGKETYIWIAITIITIILFAAIIWFNYILTTPTTRITTMNYEDFLVKYYTNQNNWLNIGLIIVGIVLAYMGIIIPIDYKSKKEELGNIVEDKLSNIDYIVEFYPKEDAKGKTNQNSWLEIYKSGKVKQGGTLYLNPNDTFPEQQLYLLHTYKSDNYSFLYSVVNPNEDYHMKISIKEKNKNFIIFRINNYRKADKQISINWQKSGLETAFLLIKSIK